MDSIGKMSCRLPLQQVISHPIFCAEIEEGEIPQALDPRESIRSLSVRMIPFICFSSFSILQLLLLSQWWIFQSKFCFSFPVPHMYYKFTISLQLQYLSFQTKRILENWRIMSKEGK